jgi:hypothetical protein
MWVYFLVCLSSYLYIHTAAVLWDAQGHAWIKFLSKQETFNVGDHVHISKGD